LVYIVNSLCYSACKIERHVHLVRTQVQPRAYVVFQDTRVTFPLTLQAAHN
jgi:hypothetical protein